MCRSCYTIRMETKQKTNTKSPDISSLSILDITHLLNEKDQSIENQNQKINSQATLIEQLTTQLNWFEEQVKLSKGSVGLPVVTFTLQ